MIPRILHQIWVNEKQDKVNTDVPETFLKFTDRWRQLHPDWGYIHWTATNIRARFSEEPLFEFYDNASAYVAAPRIYQFRSNLARLWILRDHGGVYADWDLEPRKSVEPLIANLRDDGFFLTWEIEGKRPCNAFMGGAPGHPFVKLLLLQMRKSILDHVMEMPAELNGTHYYARFWKTFGDKFPDVTIFPEAWFYPYGPRDFEGDKEYPNVYTIHHWANGRRIHKKPLEEELKIRDRST